MFIKKTICSLALLFSLGLSSQVAALDMLDMKTGDESYQMPIPAGYCDVSDQMFGKMMKSLMMEHSKDNEEIGIVSFVLNFCEAASPSPLPNFALIGHLVKETINSQADLSKYANQKIMDERFVAEQKEKALKTAKRLGTANTDITDQKVEILEEKPDYFISRTSMIEHAGDVKVEQIQYSLTFFHDGKILGYHLIAGKDEALSIPEATARLEEVMRNFNQHNS